MTRRYRTKSRTKSRTRSRTRSRNGKIRVTFRSGRVAYFKPRKAGKRANLRKLPPQLADQARDVMDNLVPRDRLGRFRSSSRRRRR